MTTIFRQILGPDVVKNAMKEHIKIWLPTYLAEVDEQRGLTRGFTATPKSWQKVPTFDNTLEEQLPAIMIICPGTANVPHKLGDSSYIADYTVGVAALIKGPDQDTASDIAGRYSAAIAACVLKKKSLGITNVEGITWEGDSYDAVPAPADRTLNACVVHFNVQMRGVISALGAPPQPQPLPDPTTPYPPLGKIPDEAHTHVTLVKKP